MKFIYVLKLDRYCFDSVIGCYASRKLALNAMKFLKTIEPNEVYKLSKHKIHID